MADGRTDAPAPSARAASGAARRRRGRGPRWSGLVFAVVACLIGYAWVDGGRRPVRPLAEAVSPRVAP